MAATTMIMTKATTPHMMSGFTLIELMTTLAVVAILASIAYPSYQGQVLKSKRAEGKALLFEVMQSQERFKTENGRYAADLIELELPETDVDSEHGYYTVKVEASVETGTGTCLIADCVVLIGNATSTSKILGSLRLRSDGSKDWKKDDVNWQQGWPDA